MEIDKKFSQITLRKDLIDKLKGLNKGSMNEVIEFLLNKESSEIKEVSQENSKIEIFNQIDIEKLIDRKISEERIKVLRQVELGELGRKLDAIEASFEKNIIAGRLMK
jgi:hypothetical protein